MHTLGPAKIIPVLRFFEPALLACDFAGLAALRFGAVSVTLPVPVIWCEENPATQALSLSDPFFHRSLTSAGQCIDSGRKRIKEEKAIGRRPYAEFYGRKYRKNNAVSDRHV
jgi:hypothetical protein